MILVRSQLYALVKIIDHHVDVHLDSKEIHSQGANVSNATPTTNVQVIVLALITIACHHVRMFLIHHVLVTQFATYKTMQPIVVVPNTYHLVILWHIVKRNHHRKRKKNVSLMLIVQVNWLVSETNALNHVTLLDRVPNQPCVASLIAYQYVQWFANVLNFKYLTVMVSVNKFNWIYNPDVLPIVSVQTKNHASIDNVVTHATVALMQLALLEIIVLPALVTSVTKEIQILDVALLDVELIPNATLARLA